MISLCRIGDMEGAKELLAETMVKADPPGLHVTCGNFIISNDFQDVVKLLYYSKFRP